MLESRFENEEQPESVHMTQSEAAEVVKLWAEKQRREISRPGFTSVRDVAEGLDIPPEQAQVLLNEVRGKREAFRELPVNFASGLQAAPLTNIGLVAFGLFFLGVLAKAAVVSAFAVIVLLIALIAYRRWALTAIVLTIAFLLAGYLFSSFDAPAPAAVSLPPPEVTAPMPPPEIPPPAVPPSPQ